jgi:hypothetical protein
MEFEPKTQEDYIKEIADKINNGKKYELENPTLEDIKNLKDFDYIVTDAKYGQVIIRKRYSVDTVLNIPTVMWYDGYEIGDTIMGMIPETYTAEEVLEGIKDFRDEDIEI